MKNKYVAVEVKGGHIINANAEYLPLIEDLMQHKELTTKEVYIYRMVSIYSKGEVFSRR